MKPRPGPRLTWIFAALLGIVSAPVALAATAADRWGPDVGVVAPLLDAPDQDGRTRSLDDLARENGLLFLFARSADW